jgi:hypothetical protein
MWFETMSASDNHGLPYRGPKVADFKGGRPAIAPICPPRQRHKRRGYDTVLRSAGPEASK